MAVQSHHDVVNQSLSADALSSADASAYNTTIFAARAAGENTSNSLRNEPPSSDNLPQAASDTSPHAKQDSAPDIRIADANTDSAFDDDAKRSAPGEGSVGSDTDTSRADVGGTNGKDGEGRESISRNAVKKSASFKPVSVTKNFLAKAGSAVTPAKAATGTDKPAGTPGGSPGPSSQNVLRPRLVAKSISGQKGSLPNASTTAPGAGQNNGPDPNQVWNKNRVLQPTATPKHLTDEELRQQYGIQLASRPIEDVDSNQAKWADIDEEDDDWAPETIEWNDGTTINLAETAAQQTVETTGDANEQAVEAAEPEPEKPKIPQPKQSSAGSNPTVLRLGSANQAKPTISSSKPTEKPTLVAKPSAPTPVKSPWATLPVVEKVSPVQVQHPVHNLPPRFGQRDPHGFDAMPPPAKEIEADDFSRFRDMPNGNPRELYVPQSGRYELVNDARRLATRKEGNFRQPAVLQRPAPGDREQAGPAEPSPAFQTSRTQQDGPSWSRRRGSSGASMENGRFARRPSFGRNYDPRNPMENQPRRGSQLEQRDASPSHSHAMSAASHSPTTSVVAEANVMVAPGPAPDQPDSAAPPGQTLEDAVAIQKRLMREKREAARKRREEEEARQEAEKRERIRLKMEQLGMATDKPEKKASKNESKVNDATETTPPTSKSIQKETKPALKEAKVVSRDVKETRLTLPESPPKPPIPSPSGEPQQYGLMKVHAPQPATAASPRGSHGAARGAAPPGMRRDSKSPARPDPKPHMANGELNARGTELLSGAKNESVPKEPGSDTRTWSSIQPQATAQFPNWSASTLAAHSPQGGNLWGPPANHRALGNGDFQSNIQRASLKPPQPPYAGPTTSTPQPIGTPRQYSQVPGGAAASSSKSDLLAGTIIEDLPPNPALSGDRENLARGLPPRPDLPMDGRSPGSHHHPPAAPGVMNPKPQPPPIDAPPTGVGAWAHFSQNSGLQEAEQSAQEHAARMAEQQLGLARPPQLPHLNETWKQVKRGDSSGTRKIVGTTTVTNNYAPSTAGPPPPADFNKTIAPPAGTPHARSRYQDIFDHQREFIAPLHHSARPISPTLPPPDSTEHPAFGMDQRPLVNLPGPKPKSPELSEKPVVKLPPPKQLPPPQPRTPTSRQISYSNIVKISPAATWQNRFDNLFDRESKVPSSPVSSATKPHFDLAPGSVFTAVSLPSRSDGKDSNLSKGVEEEEALFEEERAFGSIPTVRVPSRAAVEMWNMAPRPDYKKQPPRPLREEGVFSVRPAMLIPGGDVHDGQSTIAILLPGMTKAQLKPFSRKGQGSQRGGKPGGRSKPRSGPKPREASHGQARTTTAAAAEGQQSSPAPASSKGKAGFGGRHASSHRRPSGVAS